MQFHDYYKTLGVPRDASAEQIAKAYRKLARKLHPDINPGPDAEAKFKELNEASEVLKDPERRAIYDQLGQKASAEGGFRPPPDWDGDFQFSRAGAGHDRGFSDFFETLFGGGAGGMRDFGGTGGRDTHARIQIDLQDAYRGTTRTLNLQSPVVGPDGRVTVQDRAISVSIPQGIRAGQHIRLKGQGGPAPGGGPAGDLFLEVDFAPHPVFHVDGADLSLDLPIAPWEAALGGKVVMPTPAGKVDLRIPPGARSGQKLRLRGKGLPGPTPGDIYAKLKIVNPPATTAKAREFFKRMAQELPFDPRAKMKG